MKTVGALLTIAIGMIALFGFLNMAVMPAGDHSCPISALLGGNCPPSDNALALVDYHVSGLQLLSQSVFLTDVILAIFALLYVFFMVAVLGLKQNHISITHFLKFRLSFHKNTPAKRNFLHWLSLLNNRDPHVLNVGAR